jgi:nicotinamidase-related amidase
MSTFSNRKNSALLVIDVQNSVVSDAWHRDEVIANINTLVDGARDSGTPVIWIQHSDPWMPIGSEEWQIVEELKPDAEEVHIKKLYRSSFEETNLEETLSDLGVGHLIITGAQTNNCVRHTSHSALERGYDITLVEDAHTTSDSDWDSGPLLASAIVDETNQAFMDYSLPNRSAKIAPAQEVLKLLHE